MNSAPAEATTAALRLARGVGRWRPLEQLGRPWLLAGLVTLGAAAYTPWVAAGAQPAYVVLAAVVATLGLALGAARGSLAVAYVLFLVGFVGPDLNGHLGEGKSLLGSVRLVDIGFVATAVGVALREPTHPRDLVHRPGVIAAAAMLGVGYATALWAARGAAGSPFLNADLRLIALATLAWFICSRCIDRRIQVLVVALGALLAAKAMVIYATDLYVIGAFDRLQATSVLGNPTHRVILNGGDTLLAFVPALAAIVGTRSSEWTARVACGLAGVAAVAATSVSGTRTTLVVEVTLLLLTCVVLTAIGRGRPSFRTLIAVGLVVVAAAGLLALGGAGDRLRPSAAPDAGFSFRKQEVERFLDLGPHRTMVGGGLGASFEGRDLRGRPIETGWSHLLPVWLALKAGIAGLVLAAVALVAIVVRSGAGMKRAQGREMALTGTILVLGVVVMSVSLGRAALVEGVVVIVLGVALVTPVVPSARDRQ
jgi:hypothetical protein